MYTIGYLTQRGGGRTWANGFGPARDNIRNIASATTKRAAVELARRIIGKPSKMGTIADAYVTGPRGACWEVYADGRVESR